MADTQSTKSHPQSQAVEPAQPRFLRVETNLHLVLMLSLTFTTGMVDAIGYLGLDKVFTANMTGNVVILGMGLVGGREVSDGSGLPVLGPTIALFAFMIGAVMAGRINRSSAKGWSSTTTAMFLTTGIGVTLLGAAAIPFAPVAYTVWGFIVTGLLALFMGVQAATARRLGVADVTTVVVTSTITGLAADSRLAGGDGNKWPRRLLAVVAILVGAALGALLVKAGVGLALLVAGRVILVLICTGHALVKRAAA